MAKSFEDRDGWIWMNGNFIPWKNATSHIVSQGLHYASAVFEGERAYNGKIFKSEEHTKRFFKSHPKRFLNQCLGLREKMEEHSICSTKIRSGFLLRFCPARGHIIKMHLTIFDPG